MRFSEWKLLNENISRDFLAREAETFKKRVGDYYTVLDFETFKRPGEPEQHSNLFTNKKLDTFAVNYTTSGKLFSVDIWKPNETKPFITYYVREGSSEQVASAISTIMKDPKKRAANAQQAKHKVLQENAEDGARLEPIDSKTSTEIVSRKDPEGDYDFSNPDTIFEDLKTYIGMLIKGEQPSLLITGSPGIGKTHTVLNQLKDSGLKKEEDYIHVKGRSTAAGMYITLYENNGKIIVFDDCDSVFHNDDAVNILKGALDSYGERSISWLVGRPLKGSDNVAVPKTFIFTGKIIFISNKRQRDIDDAIKSRSFVIEVALTPEDMLKKMRKELPDVSPEVPLPVKEDAMDFIEEVSKTVENLELNMRTLVKAIKILKSVSNLKVAERLIMQQCSYK